MANQETSRGGMDEFIVDKEKVDTIHTFKEKTERLFEVKIVFDSIDKQKQWIAVHGEKIDRKNAKEYIIALCHPEAVQEFFLGSCDTDVLNEDTIEQIEKQTNAAICPINQDKVQIRGTDLAVILAVSSLESIVGQHVIDTETDGDKIVTNEKDEAIEGSNANLSRLDTTLRKTLSSQSDVTCSIDDYNQTSPSIKMTLIKCMNDFTDIDDRDLFPSTGSSCGPVSYKLPVYLDDDDEEEENDNDGKCAGKILEPQDFMDGVKSSHVGSITKQMTQTAISPSSSPKPQKSLVPDTPERQYLRKFGLSVGYSVEEVEEGLLYVDKKTKPSDFLEMLNEIKQKSSNNSNEISTEAENAKLSLNKIPENKIQMDTAKNIDQDNNSKSSFPPPPEIPTGEGAGIAGRRSLPQDYKKRLIKDFTEENGELSVKELKRRNEERQKMLRMAFDSNQSEKEKTGNIQSEGKSNKKKKRKKKKKNKAQEKEIRKTEKSTTEIPGLNVKENVSIHMISSDDEDDDGNADEEETFVFRVWKKNENKQKSDSDDECQITNVTQAVPIVVQPKANTLNQQRPRHYQPRQQLPRYSVPPPPLMDFQRYPPPYRGHPLVNKPQPYVNRPPNHQQFSQPTPYLNRPVNYLQQAPIRNAQGRQQPNQLRYVVIDGSNVAMCHGNGKVFSCKGIQIVVDYFLKRGHKQVTAFVPEWRKYNPRPENPISDKDILEKLKSDGHLVFTPSRRLNGRLIVSYDDRFVLELAEREDGIIVSNDQYRDLMGEKFSWRKIIEERLLLFSFAGDNFMPPFDPLGRDGPTLDEFLCKPTSRKRPASPPSGQVNAWQQRDSGPAIKHPGYTNKGYPSNQNFQGSPRFQQNFPQGNQGYKQQNTGNHDGFPNRGRGRGGHNNNQNSPRKQHVSVRSEEKTKEIEAELKVIFPDHLEKIQEILNNHQSETDLQKLTNYLMNAIFPS